ncbi:phage antirepressor N-terminal domain-containing protein [Candidatus Chloroploca sp. Khr17]|uniref:phage antirepressor N-terminal domain-containing protein n=1 Tax=Candidatus Chloroploca sp. Khr17 TaxID=2496869 RepID=UPI0013EBE66E|nr:phage antirepressor N-terminal domain-containing protein [Candidatus Chloroploca sp. Khr17]
MMSSDLPVPAPSPHEQLPIPLFDGVVLAVRSGDGLIFLDLRDLCATLGLDVASQRRRILTMDDVRLAPFRVSVGGKQIRTRDFLLLDDVPLWLLSVQQRRVNPEVRERFSYVKTYLVNAVRQAFAQLTGLPDAPSSTIEDLSELDRIDQALSQLAVLGQRQAELEQSQERARTAYRDLRSLLSELRERVQELEHQAHTRLSPTQRGTIYRMVQTWGQARAQHTPDLAPGLAIRRSWAEVNARFGVSTYTDLPASRYDDVVQFIQDRYRDLTGKELPRIEQHELEEFDGA